MNDIVISDINEIENRIFTIRGVQVMLDSDLAEMYQTETKYINRAMKRNPDRFPETFVFQLTEEEIEMLTSRFQIGTLNKNLRFQIGTSNIRGGRRYLPFAFTEQGVAMLSAVLSTPVAIKVSVRIINVFVEMRKFIAIYGGLLQRMDGLEQKQLEIKLETDQKFDRVFKALESKDTIPAQGVFFENQVFDAYEFTSKIIRSAEKNIILIDNYIDETTLTHLSKKKKGVKVLLLTPKIEEALKLDIQKANTQYGGFEAKIFNKSHDRFLIIDDTKEVYHLGASLKDLGRKWFAFSKMDKNSVESIVNAVNFR